MIESKPEPSQKLNWFLFFMSLPIALTSVIILTYIIFTKIEVIWYNIPIYVSWVIAPMYFYNLIQTHKAGYTKISVTSNKIFKCRESGTEEVIYVKGDSEEEVNLFLETIMEGKTFFIEEFTNKLLGFDMEQPN